MYLPKVTDVNGHRNHDSYFEFRTSLKLANRHKKRNQVGNKVKWPGYGLTLCITHCMTMHYKCLLHYFPSKNSGANVSYSTSHCT